LAEVIDASEASLGGPGGAGKMDVNSVRWWGQWFLILCVFQGHVPCGNWMTVEFNPPWSAVLVGQGKLRCAPNTVFYSIL